ncbi:hypothetical protein D3C72_2277010 [compost metagenome]
MKFYPLADLCFGLKLTDVLNFIERRMLGTLEFKPAFDDDNLPSRPGTLLGYCQAHRASPHDYDIRRDGRVVVELRKPIRSYWGL